MRQGSSVPATFDDYVRQYSRFILWAIRRVSRGRARPDDEADFVQMVHLRVHEKDYLTRCRTLITERGTGQFSTYLYWLIRSVLVNEFRANLRSPLNHAIPLPNPATDRDLSSGPAKPSRLRQLAVARLRDTTFEDRLLRDVTLDRFATFIETTQRGAQLARTLQLLYEGHTTQEMMTLCAVSQRQIVQARRDLRSHLHSFTRRVG
jgi:hypothetical protein